MASTTEKKPPKGFRARRSKSQPKPEEQSSEPESGESAEASTQPATSGDPDGGSSASSTPSSETSETAEKSKSPATDEGTDSGQSPSGGSEPEPEPGPAGLGVPNEETVMLGVSTTTDLWKYYKKLSNQTAVDGRPVKVAEIIRMVVIEALPDSSSEDGLIKARGYAEQWARTRAESSSARTNRQLFLPRSVVTELKRLSMKLEDLGHPTSTSAIICGILDRNRPSVANIYKLRKR